MAEFRLRKVPDALWKKFKRACVDADIGYNDGLIHLVRAAVDPPVEEEEPTDKEKEE